MAQQVSTIGKKKTTSATCIITLADRFTLKVNSVDLSLIKDKLMVSKLREVILTVGTRDLYNLKIEIFYKDNTSGSSVYAVREAFAKGIVAFYKKYDSESKASMIKNSLLRYDSKMFVSDPRRTEPKKFGGPGARARYQKSYR